MTTDQERRMVALIDAEIAKPEQEDSLYVRIFKAGMSAPSLSPAVQEARAKVFNAYDDGELTTAQFYADIDALIAAVRAETGDTR